MNNTFYTGTFLSDMKGNLIPRFDINKLINEVNIMIFAICDVIRALI